MWRSPAQLVCIEVQEAQLMLTNSHDSFTGQSTESRSPNTVPFGARYVWYGLLLVIPFDRLGIIFY